MAKIRFKFTLETVYILLRELLVKLKMTNGLPMNGLRRKERCYEN